MRLIIHLSNIYIVGVKFPKPTVGLGTHTKPNHNPTGDRSPNDFWPNPVEPGSF